MSKRYFNVRTVEETIDRMVLSAVLPYHRDAYTQSCYGCVCQSIRDDELLLPTDEIVLLSHKGREGVHHAILVRGDEIIRDSFSAYGEGRELRGDHYSMATTKGVKNIDLKVCARVSFHDFSVKCLEMLLEESRPSGLSSAPIAKIA